MNTLREALQEYLDLRRSLGYTYLNRQEVDALLAAPDRRSWSGRRDHALLLLAVQTGLRLSELTGLRREDLHGSYGSKAAEMARLFLVDEVHRQPCCATGDHSHPDRSRPRG